MASKPRQAVPPGPQQAGAVVEPEKDCGRRDKSVPPDSVSPHCGRTGHSGARAERPSEGTVRKPSEDKPPQPGRGGKSPSAHAPHSDDRSSK
jgi:hypothetical protein